MRTTIETNTLGIDVGGTGVKMGIIDRDGKIVDYESYPTAEWRESGNFLTRFRDAIDATLHAHKDVTNVGIGIPGTLTRDRLTLIEVPAIPELNGQHLHAFLHEFFGEEINIELENDANAAALGEYFFSNNLVEDTFAFITIGTGIGSAAIFNGKIFIGGDGNAMELGHVPSRNNQKLEFNIGRKGILSLFDRRIKEYQGDTMLDPTKEVSPPAAVMAAKNDDKFAISVFEEIGEILGEGLSALIRILDINTIIVGGGLSPSFEYIMPGINKVFDRYLSPYYIEKLRIRQAHLGNDAGLLGAASLCFRQNITV